MDLGVFVLMELSGGRAVIQTIAQVMCVVGFVGCGNSGVFRLLIGFSRSREVPEREQDRELGRENYAQRNIFVIRSDWPALGCVVSEWS
jgi:hypothetical protein